MRSETDLLSDAKRKIKSDLKGKERTDAMHEALTDAVADEYGYDRQRAFFTAFGMLIRNASNGAW